MQRRFKKKTKVHLEEALKDIYGEDHDLFMAETAAPIWHMHLELGEAATPGALEEMEGAIGRMLTRSGMADSVEFDRENAKIFITTNNNRLKFYGQ